MQKSYDYIIVGGGGSGMALGYQLINNPELAHKTILLIEADEKTSNDRTWSYWSKEPFPYDFLSEKKWDKLSFLHADFSKAFELSPYRYYSIRGIDFYQFHHREFQKAPQLTWLKSSVEEVFPLNGKMTVRTSEASFEAEKVFDSRLDQERLLTELNGYTFLWQHFLGWVIQTESPVFQADTIQMFDFTIPQENEVRFVYIIPQSNTQALVEYTIFSKEKWEKARYEPLLEDYLKHHLQLTDYVIEEEEFDAIPMTDYPFQLSNGNHIHIGIAGGRCKGSTGYAFHRMVRDAEHISKALGEGKKPDYYRKNAFKYKVYDAMMLLLMKQKGGRIAGIFSKLFRKNGTKGMLRFLDEETTFWQDLQIMNSVPAFLFIKTFFKLVLRGKKL